MRNKYFYSAFIIIFLLGVSLRFYDLTVRPVHFDEGVIGWFKLRILDACMDSGKMFGQSCRDSYKYDPEYHGPFQFVIGAWVFRLLGASDYTLRLPDSMFSAATILLLLPLRKRLGEAGTLFSAALISVSPSMVYYSQHAYSDDFFMFFALGAVVCASKYLEEKKDRWIYLGAADLALLYTVKETAYIFMGLAILYALGRAVKNGSILRTALSKKHRQLALSLAIFLVINVFFYSNMFANPSGAWDGIKAVSFWSGRSTTWSEHFQPFDYYLSLLFRYEPAALILAVAALACMKNPFAKWCAWWSFTTLAVFSLIPYKAPWLDVNFILPMCLLAGAGTECFAGRLTGPKKVIPAIFLVALLCFSAWTAWDVTYVNYSDPHESLVYAASLPAYKDLVRDVENNADRMNGKQTPIAVSSTEYWPLPWSLKDYASFRAEGGNQTAPIIISSDGNYSDIAPDLRERYDAPVRYEMRPGVFVYLYVLEK